MIGSYRGVVQTPVGEVEEVPFGGRELCGELHPVALRFVVAEERWRLHARVRMVEEHAACDQGHCEQHARHPPLVVADALEEPGVLVVLVRRRGNSAPWSALRSILWVVH